MNDMPFVAFGIDELRDQPAAYAGDSVTCPHCGAEHVLSGGTREGRPSQLLLFYKCGGEDYLGAVDNRLVTGLLRREPAVPGPREP